MVNDHRGLLARFSAALEEKRQGGERSQAEAIDLLRIVSEPRDALHADLARLTREQREGRAHGERRRDELQRLSRHDNPDALALNQEIIDRVAAIGALLREAKKGISNSRALILG